MSDIIYTPPASGGGGQNPTTNYIPLNNGTSNFVDSSIYNRKNVSTNYLSLSIDNPTDTITLGSFRNDFAGFFYNYGTTTNIEDIVFGNSANGTALEFYLDWNNFNNTYTWVSGNSNGIYINNTEISTRTNGINGDERGIKLDFNNNLYQFGDFQAAINGNSFWIDDQNNLMRTYNVGQRNGLEFDFNARMYSLGDFDSIHNGTAIFIEDANENITFRANNQITFQGNNLQDNNPRIYSGRNIVVRAPNGSTYYLPLYS
jgi:hypothetical protein